MGREYAKIEEPIRSFIEKQHMFFVATSPLDSDGLVNLSPKGLDTFCILDDTTVAYADLTGSGIETVAHLKENGRIVIMFCAFEGPPKIVRLHGKGEVIESDTHEFGKLFAQFSSPTGCRAIIRVHCQRISDSCGFGVPRMQFIDQRSQLEDWAAKKGVSGLQQYLAENNRHSLDGLPGIDSKRCDSTGP